VQKIWGTSSIHCDAFSCISVIFNDRASHDCGLSYTLPLQDGVCCGSYNGLQGAGNRDCCAVATKGVCKRNPCWPGWRPAAGCGQCVYACHRVLESGGALWHRQTLPILKYRLWHWCHSGFLPYIYPFVMIGISFTVQCYASTVSSVTVSVHPSCCNNAIR